LRSSAHGFPEWHCAYRETFTLRSMAFNRKYEINSVVSIIRAGAFARFCQGDGGKERLGHHPPISRRR
jgi:hypothetical protein